MLGHEHVDLKAARRGLNGRRDRRIWQDVRLGQQHAARQLILNRVAQAIAFKGSGISSDGHAAGEEDIMQGAQGIRKLRDDQYALRRWIKRGAEGKQPFKFLRARFPDLSGFAFDGPAFAE